MIENVFSAFDGMSMGQISLNKAGIKYKNYFASEIEPNAIKVTQSNYPNTIQVGDITKISAETLPRIDLFIGGSPCQGFSFAGKQLNFEDPRSALFFEYVRLLKELKNKNPNIKFMLENVRMKQEYMDIISEYLGVQPIEINSSIFVPQNRRRLYWTNISVEIPRERERRKLIDILLPDDYKDLEKYKLSDKAIDYMGRLRNGKPRWYYHKNPLDGVASCLTANMHKGVPYRVIQEKLRFLHPIECERLQGVPDNYTDYVPTTHRLTMLGNGWTVDVIEYIFSFIPAKKKFNYINYLINKK